MRRIKAIVAYDGTDFAGYQSQPNMRTVQSVIDKALVKLHKDRSIYSVASGRTDAGVHAWGQVIHFDTPFGAAARSLANGTECFIAKGCANCQCGIRR